MKKGLIYIFIISVLFILCSVLWADKNYSQSGININIIEKEQEIEGYWDFMVKAKNTTSEDKTLTGNLYIYKNNAKIGEGIVYLELPGNSENQELFYCLMDQEIHPDRWEFAIDEIFDFILDYEDVSDTYDETDLEDYDYSDIEDDDEFEETIAESEEYEDEEPEESAYSDFSITGMWDFQSTTRGAQQNEWFCQFFDNGTVTITEVLRAEARMPLEYASQYRIDEDIVIIQENRDYFPIPRIYFIKDENTMTGKKCILKRINY